MVKEKVIGKEKELEIEDPFISGAFLVQGLEVTAFLKTPTKVAFLIKGDIDRATERIQSNIPIGVLDFVSAVKRLRSQIFFLKSTSPSLEKVR